MAGGRPTKYKKKYCQELIDYFDRPPTEPLYKRTFYVNGQVKSEDPVIQPHVFPTFEGFARYIGVSKVTLLAWCDEHEEFLNAYTRAKEIQEDVWLQESMAGRYNAQFAKFFGVNCLGYKDKVEQETTITGYSMDFQGMSSQDTEDISG